MCMYDLVYIADFITPAEYGSIISFLGRQMENALVSDCSHLRIILRGL